MSVNPNRLDYMQPEVPQETTSTITNKDILCALDNNKFYLDKAEKIIAVTLGVLDAVSEYENGDNTSKYPLPEELDQVEHGELINWLGRLTLSRNRGMQDFVSDVVLTRSLYDLDFSDLTAFTELYGRGQTTPEVTELIDRAYEIATNTESTEPWADAPSVVKVMEGSQLVNGLMDDLDQADQGLAVGVDTSVDWLEKFGVALKQFPSIGTLCTVAGLAYLDTLRGVINQAVGNQFISLPNHRPRLIQDPLVACYTASTILDAALLAADEDDPVSRFENLASSAGISLSKLRSLQPGELTSQPGIANGKKALITNAHDSVAYINKFVVQNANELNNLFEPGPGGVKEFCRLNLVSLIDLFEIANSEFYLDFATAPESEEGGYSQLLQHKEAEEIKNERMSRLLGMMLSSGVFSKAEVSRMNALVESSIANYIEEHDKESRLEEVKLFVDQEIERAKELELPYKYTSSKIRSFDGGLDYYRELTDMDIHDLTISAAGAQTLAILVLQSEQAEDKSAYFDRLASSRDRIEIFLREFESLGLPDAYSSDLINTLKWLDEVVDSGKDLTIKDRRLQKFLDAYYLGVDTEVEGTAVKEAEDTPAEEVVDEVVVEVSEEPVEQQIEELEETEIETVPEVKALSPIEAYIQILGDILNGVEISRADVDVFPPGVSERIAHRNTSRRNESLIDIDPARLENLVEMKRSLEHKGKVASLMVTNPTRWSPLPLFVLYVQNSAEEQVGVCLIESPVNGNASYIYTVDGTLIQNWEEVAETSRPEARELGANTFVHPTKGSSTLAQHYSLRLMNHMIIELAAQA